jgi:hypothetical protein
MWLKMFFSMMLRPWLALTEKNFFKLIGVDCNHHFYKTCFLCKFWFQKSFPFVCQGFALTIFSFLNVIENVFQYDASTLVGAN